MLLAALTEAALRPLSDRPDDSPSRASHQSASNMRPRTGSLSCTMMTNARVGCLSVAAACAVSSAGGSWSMRWLQSARLSSQPRRSLGEAAAQCSSPQCGLQSSPLSASARLAWPPVCEPPHGVPTIAGRGLEPWRSRSSGARRPRRNRACWASNSHRPQGRAQTTCSADDQHTHDNAFTDRQTAGNITRTWTAA